MNLTGVFLCGREAAIQMIKGGEGGCIINISSISRAGNMGQSNYSAAKAGVASMAVVWAKELARYGIRANAIAPGFIATEMTASMKPEALEKMTAGIPAKRMGVPDEIAHAVTFLLENDYMSGPRGRSRRWSASVMTATHQPEAAAVSAAERLYTVLAAIPAGTVITYGQLAALAGYPRRARWVGQMLQQLPEGSRLALASGDQCSQGRSSFPSDSPAYALTTARCLRAEGVEISPSGRISLQRYGLN